MFAQSKRALRGRAATVLRVAGAALLSLVMHEPASADEQAYARDRERMVREQIERRGIRDSRVLEAMRTVPRHLFVPAGERRHAYMDAPLPIGSGQTISQPYIVALMTGLVRPEPTDRALEIGTGSGYQAAVLGELVAQVYTIELEQELAHKAQTVLRDLDYGNVTVRVGDGYAGWPELAPFDIIVVTAAPDHVPKPLLDQLKAGGRLILPVGRAGSTQTLRLIEKDAAGQLKTTDVSAVMFVPLRREASD